jgi:hypothetical protein
MNDVEARATGGQLDDRLLALLLFRHLFGMNLDARQLFEFLLMLLKDFAARALDKVHLERGARIFLPVNRGSGERRADACHARCGDCRRTRQKLAACWMK